MGSITTLGAGAVAAPFARLREANLALARRYPGDTGARQPVHTVYGGAHLFKADSAKKLGQLALRALEENAPDAAAFAGALGLTGDEAMARTVYGRVIEKLGREPVEDYRIDYEDGYGYRPDAEEDAHAESAARELAQGHAAGTLPPFIGLRIKPWSEELRARSLRTLDIFLTTYVANAKALPAGFVITLPKVQIPEQPAALADVLATFEDRLHLPSGSLKLEIMIETTPAIAGLSALREAAGGRCVSAHFGTYDYTASCGITAAYQRMGHPACDFAKQMMLVAYAGTGITLSDGATNVMPIGPHRQAKGGPPLSPPEIAENRAVVSRAWKLHFDDCRRSLAQGFYQGWDLHPAQLPTRYAAVYSFFLEGLPAASERLKSFLGKAAQATLAGNVFDDAATGQGLLNFFLRGLACGALTEDEALGAGIGIDELRTRSFSAIVAQRRPTA